MISLMYRVIYNGDLIVETPFYKEASDEYDKCIYNGKSGDIIQLWYYKDPKRGWELARKDWM